MPVQLTSRNITWPESSDRCVINRYNKTGPEWTSAVVYSGICDMQEGAGDITYNEAGVIIKADAKCFLDGIVPILLDDEIVFNGNPLLTYVVISTSQWTMFPIHTELNLKRGGIAYGGTT